MIGELPQSLTVNGTDYSIRTDFRDILKILCAFNDPELNQEHKIYVCLLILYKDFENMPKSDYEEAFKIAINFIDNNAKTDRNKPTPRTMDWEQDEAIMFAAVNKVAGFETRSTKYIHWWTFLGYYMEISGGVFATVLGLRAKKAKHKPLDNWEKEYWNSNKELCELKARLSEEEQKAKEKLNKLLG